MLNENNHLFIYGEAMSNSRRLSGEIMMMMKHKPKPTVLHSGWRKTRGKRSGKSFILSVYLIDIGIWINYL